MGVLGSNCWEWTGTKWSTGYGRIGSTLMAHRVVYENWRGPIPDGLHLDHLCRNRACVRPDHLEPVTCKENLLRGETVNATNAAKTHCVRGHEFDRTVTRNGSVRRTCSQCIKIYNQQAYAKRKSL